MRHLQAELRLGIFLHVICVIGPWAKADIKIFCSHLILLDFFTLFYIFCPQLCSLLKPFFMLK